MRILFGFQDADPGGYDPNQWDARCVMLNADGKTAPATIAEMLQQCPPGWRPDVYYHAGLGYFPLPADIEDFSGLTVAGLSDWDRLGRAAWAGAPFFDLIVTERGACDILHASGHPNARFARMWGVNPKLHRLLPDVERDIDVLFVGTLTSSIWYERNMWLDRLARLSDRFHVVIASGHHGDHYVRLLNRAKIVFNRSVRGETNQRTYESAACGALVFNEAENAETREILEDGVHCVYYTPDNLEERLAWYLAHDAERERIAEAGRQVVTQGHTHEEHPRDIFALIEANLDKAGIRPAMHLPVGERLVRKAMQIFGAHHLGASIAALNLLNKAESEGIASARTAEARASFLGWLAHYAGEEHKAGQLSAAISFARYAMQQGRENAVAMITLAFLLLERAEVTKGQSPAERNDIGEAVGLLEKAANLCENPEVSSGALEGFGYPRWTDSYDMRLGRAWMFRTADEARWASEMRTAMANRCRQLLSDIHFSSGNRSRAYALAESAARLLPTDADSWLRAARYAAASRQWEAAAGHYREALALAPLNYEVWPEYAKILMGLGRREEAEAFVQERLRAVKAIPALAAMRATLLAVLDAAGEGNH